jgi:hypothetical protein
LVCLFFAAALLLSVAACRPAAPSSPVNIPDTVATAVAATVAARPAFAPPTAEPSPTVEISPTPDTVGLLVGQWRHEHAEEGLHYVQVIDFFADGLYAVRTEGTAAYCHLFSVPMCELMPDMPINESDSGTYEVIDGPRLRLRRLDGSLDVFNIAYLDAARLTLEQDGEEDVFEKVE